MNFAPPPFMKLNDLISGTVVTMDEWIKNEIYRLQNNIKPRHFQNYSELAEMLHEDPGRFQHHHHQQQLSQPPPLMEDFIHNSSSSDEEEGEAREDDDDDEVEEVEEEEDADTDDDDDDDDDDSQEEQEAEQQQHTQLTPLRPAAPPSWLCKVFIELIRYCARITIKDNAPKLLLHEFETLRMHIKLGKSIQVDEFRENLQQILFGKIQMTENLVQVWKLMCEWVTKPPLHTHQNATRWLDLTLSAYLAARFIIVGNQE